ncbi:MAG TPA: hypothetical protein VH988_08945 [Thermoanaerobaculia bacterium]|nr:hypothetical protein [Thermoanaerobaculia bacterium]
MNQRSRRTAALVVALFLLAALPAAAGGSAKPQTAQTAAQKAGGIWEGLLARVIAWVGGPWQGTSAVAGTDSSANIDPLGQH